MKSRHLVPLPPPGPRSQGSEKPPKASWPGAPAVLATAVRALPLRPQGRRILLKARWRTVGDLLSSPPSAVLGLPGFREDAWQDLILILRRLIPRKSRLFACLLSFAAAREVPCLHRRPWDFLDEAERAEAMRPPPKRQTFPPLNPEEVLQGIRELVRRHGRLPSTTTLRGQEAALLRDACRHFGHWTRAAVLAGVSHEQMTVRWDREILLLVLGRLQQAGEDLLARGSKRRHARLVFAAERLGLDWEEAVQASLQPSADSLGGGASGSHEAAADAGGGQVPAP